MQIKEINSKGYIAYVLSEKSRKSVLQEFPPLFDKFFAHHVTYQFGVSHTTPLPDQPTSVKLVQEVIDEELNVQCFVVEVNGSTRRPDGGTFHLTFSLDPAVSKPKDSNQAIENAVRNGTLDNITPVEIIAVPMFIPF